MFPPRVTFFSVLNKDSAVQCLVSLMVSMAATGQASNASLHSVVRSLNGLGIYIGMIKVFGQFKMIGGYLCAGVTGNAGIMDIKMAFFVITIYMLF